MDIVLQWLSSNPVAATAVATAVSVLAIGVVLMYLVAFGQGRQVSFWPPGIGARPTEKGKPNSRSTSITSQANSRKPSTDLEKEVAQLREEVRKQRAKLVYIYNLHKTTYQLAYWRLTYTIDVKGGVHTREEMSIFPVEQAKVHFRQLILGISSSVKGDIAVKNLQAINTATNQRLDLIEISKDTRRHTYAIVLDPPATKDKPTEIAVESFRPGVFEPLISELHDCGSIRILATSHAKAEVRLVAPPNIAFTAFSVSPDSGSWNLEAMGSVSSIVWRAENLPDGTYAYAIQARRREA